MTDLAQTDYTTCSHGGEHCQHRSSASVGSIWGLEYPREFADQYRCCKCGEEWWLITAVEAMRTDCRYASKERGYSDPFSNDIKSRRWARKPW